MSIDLNGVLPEGNNGIAAKYKGDVGIESDPAVILADDFESYECTDDMARKWSILGNKQRMTIIDDPSYAYRGRKCLQFDMPQQERELSVELTKVLLGEEEKDVLFLRCYSKFEPTFNVRGSSHNGIMMSGGNYFPNGRATPGLRADGYNKCYMSYEHWRFDDEPNPGRINVYVYHAEQREGYGDHFFPTGEVTPQSHIPFDFGPNFIPRPDIVPELGRWYCYEFMTKLNTPGKRDGRIACWLDGKLVADFPNLNIRYIDSLKLNRFILGLHIKNNKLGATKKWFDNVVAATSYIGPISE